MRNQKSSLTTHTLTIREKELQLVLKQAKSKIENAAILEVGCGEGAQAVMLQKIANLFVASDISYKVKFHVPFCQCSVESLSFRNSTFDVVFSSHLLEHVNSNKALQEIRRVLKKDGELICVVPTSLWKILQLLLFYPKMLPLNILARRKPKLKPKIHGNFESNWRELNAYAPKSWCTLIERNGFKIRRVVKLLLYCTLGERLRKRNITLVPPQLHLEGITNWYTSMAIFARAQGSLKEYEEFYACR